MVGLIYTMEYPGDRDSLEPVRRTYRRKRQIVDDALDEAAKLIGDEKQRLRRDITKPPYLADLYIVRDDGSIMNYAAVRKAVRQIRD